MRSEIIIFIIGRKVSRMDGRESFILGKQAARAGDYKRAKSYYEQAVALNNPEAMNNLGILYSEGRGVPTNYAKAKQLFEQAISLGYISATVNLGNLYLRGTGVPKDYARAKQLYEQASEAGYAEGLANLAIMYADGVGIPISIPTAISLLIQAFLESKDSKYLDQLHRLLLKGQNLGPFVTECIDVMQENRVLRETIHDLRQTISDLENQIEYQPGGPKYTVAREHFYHGGKPPSP